MLPDHWKQKGERWLDIHCIFQARDGLEFFVRELGNILCEKSIKEDAEPFTVDYKMVRDECDVRRTFLKASIDCHLPQWTTIQVVC